jgi:hypothetical protein
MVLMHHTGNLRVVSLEKLGVPKSAPVHMMLVTFHQN